MFYLYLIRAEIMYFIPRMIVASDRIAVLSHIVHFVFKSFIYCRFLFFKKRKSILYANIYIILFIRKEYVCMCVCVCVLIDKDEYYA